MPIVHPACTHPPLDPRPLTSPPDTAQPLPVQHPQLLPGPTALEGGVTWPLHHSQAQCCTRPNVLGAAPSPSVRAYHPGCPPHPQAHPPPDPDAWPVTGLMLGTPLPYCAGPPSLAPPPHPPTHTALGLAAAALCWSAPGVWMLPVCAAGLGTQRAPPSPVPQTDAAPRAINSTHQRQRWEFGALVWHSLVWCG
jgi:hypothetical protein